MTCSEYLYRAFTDFRYAREFVSAGRFRLGRLDRYREIENAARVDAAEGYGHYVDQAGIHEHFRRGEPIYLLCCSGKDVDLTFLRRKMGPAIVRINDPQQLATDITDYLERMNIKLFGKVLCRKVDYTKGTVIESELDPMQRAELSTAQKHPCFREEREQRLYAVINVACPTSILAPHVDIDLGHSLSYVEVLPCEKA